ncbi:MAG TPA: hypothetical protein VEI47_02740 [Gemmatimonadales bacterium]|nr:hypothetical protein [Gemmatimonadales bacterium]
MTTGTLNETKETPAATASPDSPRPSTAGPIYRSVADGELKTPWSLAEYFASLNTVMRLPAKVRRKAEAVAKRTPGGEKALAALDMIKLPRWVVPVTVTVGLLLLVVKPLVLAASGSGGNIKDLSPAYGVWQAGKGRYSGRTFQVSETAVAFQGSSRAEDLSWYDIQGVKVKAVGDSTLYTVTYNQNGKSAELAFWYLGGNPATIRFAHQQGGSWTKTLRPLSSRPGH